MCFCEFQRLTETNISKLDLKNKSWGDVNHQVDLGVVKLGAELRPGSTFPENTLEKKKEF